MARWGDKPKAEQKADINRYKASLKALHNHQRTDKDREETATYRQLNAAVLDAEKEIPWWAR
jgi:hypothetical protein